jgi:hypothetical protein
VSGQSRKTSPLMISTIVTQTMLGELKCLSINKACLFPSPETIEMPRDTSYEWMHPRHMRLLEGSKERS